MPRASAPTEAQYTTKLRKALKDYYDYGIVDFKMHGGPYQQSGLPDIICCVLGNFVAFELKRPGNKPTPQQQATIDRIYSAGGYAAIVPTNLDITLVMARLDQFIKSKRERQND